MNSSGSKNWRVAPKRTRRRRRRTKFQGVGVKCKNILEEIPTLLAKSDTPEKKEVEKKASP